MRKVDAAIADHQMIRDGDRVLVGFSGGKDSYALLRLLIHRRSSCKERYAVVAAHIVGDARGASIGLPEIIRDELVSSGIGYHIRELPVETDEPLPMDCDRCSRYRRKALFHLANELGCNCLALGHNLEDFAHTALMNLFTHGRLETMSYAADYFDAAIRLVRPLAYVTEHEIRRFGRASGYVPPSSECPLADTSRRQSARDTMRLASKEFRFAAQNIVKAARPLNQADDHSP